MSFIEKLVEFVAPPKAKKLDGTTQATLARSLSALPPAERGWIRFAEAHALFSTKGAQYAFGTAPSSHPDSRTPRRGARPIAATNQGQPNQAGTLACR